MKLFYVSIVDLGQDSYSDSEEHGRDKKKKNRRKSKEKSHGKGKDNDLINNNSRKLHGSWNKELKAAHACTKHGGQYCVMLPNLGEHRVVEEKKLSLWGLLMAQGIYHSVTIPPE
ncbi:hypothetical protein V5O48_007188 [Marasmius crinis-equi]|uniref:Uncharacterized protein n=1 Tax=Marasmius crinis-equi TaxID=585013 RepID=A0ABR3FHL6_9AGAR